MIRFLLFFLIGAALISSSCRKEIITGDPGARLTFSTDTVQFDTIFTSIGSSTHIFQVFNPNRDALRMDISLAGGEKSPFRINIDGRATTSFKDYELAGKDSMFIFAEVTIDPVGGNLPMVVMDSIMFEFNGNRQRVILAAFGQDVHLLNDAIIPCNSTWINDKPYLIWNRADVSKGCKLTIEQGTKVYGHRGAALVVYGQLEVNGTKDEPVIFSGDRREKAYSTTSGQWHGIILAPGSVSNTIMHAIIENANVGLEVDSLPPASGYNLKLEKTIIRNMAAIGLWGQSSTIDASNVLIHACGQFTFLGDFGGDYDFVNCTFDDSYLSANRKLPSVVITNRDIPTYPPNPVRALFRNSIIWGSLENEIGFDFSGKGEVKPFTFQNNIIKLKDQIPGLDASNKLNTYPKFKNYLDGDYQLDTLSPAINAGFLFDPPYQVLDDLNDKPRIGTPDIGCFEKE
jgi:hypothetical protein